jgi:ribosome-associated protein
MAKKTNKPESEKLSHAVVNGMQEVKASDIVVMDLRKIKSAVADFFIICSGGSDKQVDAIAQSIDKEVYKNLNENPWHTEGKGTKEWVIIDYISVVAHVFRKDRRPFFGLEKLWGDAEITEIDDNPAPAKKVMKKEVALPLKKTKKVAKKPVNATAKPKKAAKKIKARKK